MNSFLRPIFSPFILFFLWLGSSCGDNSALPASKSLVQDNPPEINDICTVKKNGLRELLLTPLDSHQKPFVSLSDFISHISNDTTFAINFTKSIAKVADEFGIENNSGTDGFTLESTLGSALVFKILASQDLNPSKDFTHRTNFKNYVDPGSFKMYFTDLPEGQLPANLAVQTDNLQTSPHTLSFFRYGLSTEGGVKWNTVSSFAAVPDKLRILVIPAKKTASDAYVTIYDFSKQASDEEITDFWRLVKKNTDQMRALNFKISSLNSNAISGQGVYHFHLHLRFAH